MWHEFGALRSPELGEVIKEGPLAILPVGQTEEHGPHLPINADSVIAAAVGRAIAERLGETLPILLMETVVYGYSGKTMLKWPGTMRVSMDTTRDYVYELCRSLVEMGVKRIAIINGHGHHTALLELVARRLVDETGVAPVVLSPAGLAAQTLRTLSKGGPRASCHGGEFETSLMLHLEPDSVDLSAAPENPVADVGLPAAGVFWSTWQRQETPNGIYGVASVASAETGKALFEAMVSEGAKFLEKYYRHVTERT